MDLNTIMNNNEEQQYLDLIKEVLKVKDLKNNRTGIPTLSLFGKHLRFNLSNNVLPVLTTKKVNFKAVVGELIWMLKGQTDNSILKKQGINIWSANSSKNFLKKNNLPYEEDDIGPGYGFQWRHWGAKYIDCKTNYKGQGFDQISNVIDLIKNDPNNRRIIINAWNVSDLNKMALPPCHCFTQFYVDGDYLSSVMYQRSADIGLGVPFNICSEALKLYIISKLTNKKPLYFNYMLGDYHIYENHIEGLKKQIELQPFNFPTIKIKEFNSIDDLTIDHFELNNYVHHVPIKLEMAV